MRGYDFFVTGFAKTGFKCRGHAHEVRQGLCLHLPHDAAAMNLEGVLCDTQLRCSLLVQKAGNRMVEYFHFTGCERLPSRQQAGALDTVRASFQILEKSALNGRDQLVEVDWLDEKIDRSVLHRAHRRRRVTVRCDEDDRGRSAADQPVLHLQAIDVWQHQIEDQTGGAIVASGGDVFSGATERGYMNSLRKEEVSQPGRSAEIVADKMHDGVGELHGSHQSCEIVTRRVGGEIRASRTH